MSKKQFRRQLRRKEEILAAVIPSVATDPGVCLGNPGCGGKQEPRSLAALGITSTTSLGRIRAISPAMTGMNVAAGGQS
jgi:hypothetical protein